MTISTKQGGFTMLSFRSFILPVLLSAALVSACDLPVKDATDPAHVVSSEWIMDACMKVQIPAALKQLGLVRHIRTRNDAMLDANFICQKDVQFCNAYPESDDCQASLARYGLDDPSYRPSPGSSLFNAAYAGNTTIVGRLLADGADPNWQNVGGWTPLMIAAAEKHLDTVVVLLEAKANPNALNLYGRSALMFASGYGQDTIVEHLLAAGAEPNIVPRDQSGWTALMQTAANGHTSTVELLLRHGADPRIKSKDGKTANDLAKSAGHAKVVQILSSLEN